VPENYQFYYVYAVYIVIDTVTLHGFLSVEAASPEACGKKLNTSKMKICKSDIYMYVWLMIRRRLDLYRDAVFRGQEIQNPQYPHTVFTSSLTCSIFN
jgi:hypothetical protein